MTPETGAMEAGERTVNGQHAERGLPDSQLRPGLHPNIPMRAYLAIDAMGSSRLEHLAISPLHYRYMSTQPDVETDAQELGTALHVAVLEPDLFKEKYVIEPDTALIGGAKPRATNAYRQEVARLEFDGRTVLKAEAMARVLAMREAILGHPHAARVLENAPEREVTGLWLNGKTLCRGRFDAMGPGVLADIKTTRKLKDFSPWTLTRLGYYRQAGHYVDGARKLGRETKHFFFIAVENNPPHDVGVFVLDEELIEVGRVECEALMARLARCERTGVWPGMYPEIQQAVLTEAIALQMADADVEDFDGR